MDHAGPVAFIRFGTLLGVPDCFISKGTNDTFIAIVVYTLVGGLAEVSGLPVSKWRLEKSVGDSILDM